ncbi:MAG: hypothetical protein IJF71_00390 [Clostridia bacterium]|nr:hypothetical protein [Clostridia bacterium]
MKKKLALCFALAAIMIFAMTGCLQLEVVEASIQIDELPKTTYYVGESMPSFSVKLIENEATTKVITYGEDELLTVSGFSTENVGKFEAKVSYQYSSSKILSFTFEYTVTDGLQYGSGTMLDPYQLYTASDLMQAIKDNQGAYKYYRLENNLDFAGVDMAAYNAAVAGTTFAGTLDGNGFQIANFRNTAAYAVEGKSNEQINGIFYQLGNFTAKDLTLFNCSVDRSDGKYVGILAWGSKDQNVSFTFDNVNTRGNSYAIASSNVGGLIGNGRVGAITIKNCSNVADVKGQGNGAGGFVGTTSGTTVVIENSENSGDISGAFCIGGMIGNGCNSGTYTLNNVTNSGTIIASNAFRDKGIKIGAVIGGESNVGVIENTKINIVGNYENSGELFVPAQDVDYNTWIDNDNNAIKSIVAIDMEWKDGVLSVASVNNAESYVVTTYVYAGTQTSAEKKGFGAGFTLVSQEKVAAASEITMPKYAMIFARCGEDTEDYECRQMEGYEAYFTAGDAKWEGKATITLPGIPVKGEICCIGYPVAKASVYVSVYAYGADGSVLATSTFEYTLEA